MLFVDTAQAAKAGSDVNFVCLELLPSLKQGVVIHFSDIFFPYDKAVERFPEGPVPATAHILRMFLMYNSAFEILMFNNYLAQFVPERLRSRVPPAMEEPGSSIWFRRK